MASAEPTGSAAECPAAGRPCTGGSRVVVVRGTIATVSRFDSLIHRIVIGTRVTKAQLISIRIARLDFLFSKLAEHLPSHR